jgi:acyl-homoserine lactone synthase
MFTVHIVRHRDRPRYQPQLESYFRIRHQIYVVERGWTELDRPIPCEMDAFDKQDTIYLLGVDEVGEVAASCRLVPSVGPHLLADVFPGLVEGIVPRDREQYEWTRFFVISPLRGEGASAPASGRMLCGLLEACIVLGIKRLSVVCEAFWPRRLSSLGWQFQRLGPELTRRDGKIVALLIDVNVGAIQKTRCHYAIQEPSVLAAEPLYGNPDTPPGR